MHKRRSNVEPVVIEKARSLDGGKVRPASCSVQKGLHPEIRARDIHQQNKVLPGHAELPDASRRCAGGALKPALVLPPVSKRLTMGRSAEGEIKHACRLVFLWRIRPRGTVALAQ